MNSGFNKALLPPPLLDVVRDVGGLILPKSRQQVHSEIISERKLEVTNDSISQVPKTAKHSRRQLNVPFCCSTRQGSLE